MLTVVTLTIEAHSLGDGDHVPVKFTLESSVLTLIITKPLIRVLTRSPWIPSGLGLDSDVCEEAIEVFTTIASVIWLRVEFRDDHKSSIDYPVNVTSHLSSFHLKYRTVEG